MIIYILVLMLVIVGVGSLVFYVIQEDKKSESEPVRLRPLAADSPIRAETGAQKQEAKPSDGPIKGMVKKWPILDKFLKRFFFKR